MQDTVPTIRTRLVGEAARAPTAPERRETRDQTGREADDPAAESRARSPLHADPLPASRRRGPRFPAHERPGVGGGHGRPRPSGPIEFGEENDTHAYPS
jgi:hypothetical protein